jgi:energy-converting hydrogenase A subunit R
LTAQRPKKIFVCDCEGPISRNDNAYELTSHFIPNGDKFFSLISKYDDILADVLKKEDYKAGDTLKLILPFLKAFNVTNQKMEDFAAKNIVLVPGARDTLQFVRKIMPSFIVSTSYEHYISALCKAVNFPFENTYCTRANIDKYQTTKEETETLKQLAKEIATMPMFEIPKNTKSLKDLSPRDQATIRGLDEILWGKIPSMPVGRMFDEVNPIGGREKASAVEKIVARKNCNVDCVMYVGDSITDVECFQFVRNGDGLTISFNGNEYAVREAEIAVMSENTIVTSILAAVFAQLDKDAVLQLVKEWSFPALRQFNVKSSLIMQAQKSYPRNLPRVEVVTKENKDELIRESVVFRKKVRGEAIAKLG